MNYNNIDCNDSVEKLLKIIEVLLSESGCPWDKNQTPLSMRGSLIEETFETVDAINSDEAVHIKEELGDVLFNVLLISFMYQKENIFSVNDVFSNICNKLIRRHPHVFCTKEKLTQEQVNKQWDLIKENIEGRKTDRILDQVPDGYPPLLKSFKMLKKASKKCFEWDSVQDAENKVKEEFGEVIEAYSLINENNLSEKPFTKNSSKENDKLYFHLEEEIGDLLFSVISLSNIMNINPIVALSRTNKKFYKRFNYVEKKMNENNLSMDKENRQKMVHFWNEAKHLK